MHTRSPLQITQPAQKDQAPTKMPTGLTTQRISDMHVSQNHSQEE